MKYNASATPRPSPGETFTGESIVVPNMSMSLEEILQRFTRGEPLAIGKEDPVYHESDDDLEKVSHLDMVDRAEYVEKLKVTQKEYEKQEKRKAKAERERLDKLAVEKLAAEKLAAEKNAK